MEGNKPNVFPEGAPQQNIPQQPYISEGERQMIANRERERAEREMAKALPNSIQSPLSVVNTPQTPIVEPDFGSDFDLIPLPSEGKVYKNKKSTLKVSFLNASDENILTNPNLLKSGRFLEVLLSRKILEPSLSYRDLVIGDRDAIMIWLRSSGYGSTYPIQVMDPETYEEFTTEIELDELKIKKLQIEPDEEGYFSFLLPQAQKNIKFRLLTVGDSEDVENHANELKKNPNSNFDLATYTLQKQIVEVEGNRDPQFIKDFVSKIRIGDSRAFKKYVSENECGVDLKLTVQAPGGGLVKTFFPLNPRFFWPEL